MNADEQGRDEQCLNHDHQQSKDRDTPLHIESEDCHDPKDQEMSTDPISSTCRLGIVHDYATVTKVLAIS